MAHVLESLGRVLTANVEEDFLTTSVDMCQRIEQFYDSAKSGVFSEFAGPESQGVYIDLEEKESNVRVLIDEARRVVDLVMDNNVQVLLGVVLRDVGVGEFLGGHCEERRGAVEIRWQGEHGGNRAFYLKQAQRRRQAATLTGRRAREGEVLR